MEIKATTRRWGNSIAIVIPREFVEKERIKEDQTIVLTISQERPKAGDVFGLARGRLREPTQKIKDEMRQGWESASDKER